MRQNEQVIYIISIETELLLSSQSLERVIDLPAAWASPKLVIYRNRRAKAWIICRAAFVNSIPNATRTDMCSNSFNVGFSCYSNPRIALRSK